MPKVPAFCLRLGCLPRLAVSKKEKAEAMKPDPIKYEAAKLRLRNQLSKIIRESEQLYRDVCSYNDFGPEHVPFDTGKYLVTIDLAKQILALIDQDKLIPRELMDRFTTIEP